MHVRKHHPVAMYVAGKSKPELPNDRLVVLSWKGNKATGREAHSARCFSVPVWVPCLTGEDKDFVDILIDAVEQRQKIAAHKYVTDMLDKNGGVCNDIPANILEPSAILAEFMSEENEDGNSRGKLSGDQIKIWYADKLDELVQMKVAENKGYLADGYEMTEEEMKTIKQSSNGYRATLERLAAPQPKLDINTAKALKKAVELLPEEIRGQDGICRKIEKKLEMIINPPADKEITLADLF